MAERNNYHWCDHCGGTMVSEKNEHLVRHLGCSGRWHCAPPIVTKPEPSIEEQLTAARLVEAEIAALLRANGVAPGSTLSMVQALVEREKALRETLRAYRDEAAEASYDRHHHAGSGGY